MINRLVFPFGLTAAAAAILSSFVGGFLAGRLLTPVTSSPNGVLSSEYITAATSRQGSVSGVPVHSAPKRTADRGSGSEQSQTEKIPLRSGASVKDLFDWITTARADQRESHLEDLAARLAGLDAEQIWRVASEFPQRDFQTLISTVAAALRDPRKLQDLLTKTESLPNAVGRAQLQFALADSLGRCDISGAGSWLNPSIRASTRMEISRGVASGIAEERGLAAARAWVQSLPTDAQYNAIETALTVGVTRGETAEALAWLASQNLPSRDLYIAKIVPLLIDRDPERAVAASALLTDGVNRERLQGLTFAALKKIDEAAADNWAKKIHLKP